jgi:hypothetical protein
MAIADVRSAVSFEGLHTRYATLKHSSNIVYDASKAGGSAQVELAVTLSADDTVDLVGDSEHVYGKLVKVEPDGFCVVQTGGYCTLPAGDGATVAVGAKIIGDLGAASAEGYIQSLPAASAGSAAEINQLQAARGRIVNNDATTAVVVDLDA